MALSDQLTDLADRTKQLEDAANAAKAKNRAKLEQQRDELHSKVEKDAQSIHSSAGMAGAGVRSWWAETAAHMEQQRTDLRDKIQQQQTERKVQKAESNAADAEDYATNLVSLAAYVVDAAEYAVVDAAIARSTADDLASSS